CVSNHCKSRFTASPRVLELRRFAFLKPCPRDGISPSGDPVVRQRASPPSYLLDRPRFPAGRYGMADPLPVIWSRNANERREIQCEGVNIMQVKLQAALLSV